jgi:Predicted hydrolases or acyltransferases (alpha/beta hydrolase superfamily)
MELEIIIVGYVEVNGKKLHYNVEGEGSEVIVLLHGIPGFCYDFRKNVKPLSKRFKVVTIDLKGFGHSEKGDWRVEEFRNEVMAEEVINALQLLGFKDFTVLGHDIGSIISQLISLKLNNKLILINPAYKGMRYRWREIANEYWYIFFHQTPLAEKMITSYLEDYLRYFFDSWTVQKFQEEEIEEYIKVYKEENSIKAVLSWYRAYVKYFKWSSIGKIKAPSLIMWSDSDPLFPFSWSDKLGEGFEEFKLVKINEAGHWPHIERADLVNKAIEDFMIGGL